MHVQRRCSAAATPVDLIDFRQTVASTSRIRPAGCGVAHGQPVTSPGQAHPPQRVRLFGRQAAPRNEGRAQITPLCRGRGTRGDAEAVAAEVHPRSWRAAIKQSQPDQIGRFIRAPRGRVSAVNRRLCDPDGSSAPTWARRQHPCHSIPPAASPSTVPHGGALSGPGQAGVFRCRRQLSP